MASAAIKHNFLNDTFWGVIAAGIVKARGRIMLSVRAGANAFTSVEGRGGVTAAVRAAADAFRSVDAGTDVEEDVKGKGHLPDC